MSLSELESLDIVDAEYMIHTQQSASGPSPGTESDYLMEQSVDGDPWFNKMNEENKMLERHIRTLRHIIESETQRCNFKEIIVGKSIHSPKGSAKQSKKQRPRK